MVLDGKAVAAEEKQRICREAAEFGSPVSLSVILVGDNPASKIYVSSKEKACGETGIRSDVVRMPAETTEAELIALIKKMNSDASVNGILVQLPLPEQIDENLVLETIDPLKDVDCFHPYNFGRLFAGNSVVEPCTPKGIMKILEFYKINVAGKNAVVLGRSNIVGKPAAMLLMQQNATVTICHSKTKGLTEVCLAADIIIAAIGRPLFLKADMVKTGAVVIDVGINRIDDASSPKGYKVVGDADYDALIKKGCAVTPVPGGVGVMTIAMLLDNTLKLARLQRERA